MRMDQVGLTWVGSWQQWWDSGAAWWLCGVVDWAEVVGKRLGGSVGLRAGGGGVLQRLAVVTTRRFENKTRLVVQAHLSNLDLTRFSNSSRGAVKPNIEGTFLALSDAVLDKQVHV